METITKHIPTCNDEQPQNVALGIIAIDAGKYTLARELQERNTLCSIYATELGIKTVLMTEFPENANARRDSTEFDIFT